MGSPDWATASDGAIAGLIYGLGGLARPHSKRGVLLRRRLAVDGLVAVVMVKRGMDLLLQVVETVGAIKMARLRVRNRATERNQRLETTNLLK